MKPGYNESTIDSLTTSRQFGVAIGTFQALQRRMIEVVISIEHARPMSHLACATVYAGADPLERLAALDPDTAFDLPSKEEVATQFAALTPA